MGKQYFFLVLFLVGSASGIFTTFQASEPISYEDLTQDIAANLDQLMDVVEEEAKMTIQHLQREKSIADSQFHFLVMQEDSLIAWSDHHFIPPIQSLLGDFDVKFLKWSAGEFFVKRWKVDKKRALFIIVPLHVQYKISNSYLTPFWNREIFDSQNIVLLEPGDIKGYPILFDQKVAFRVLPISNSSLRNGLWQDLTIAFFALAIFALFVLILHRIKIFSEKYPDLGFLILLLGVVMVRAIMILLEFPSRFTDASFFDPTNFASSEFNPSMGDLVLNSVALLFLCQYLFRNYYRFLFFRYFLSSQMKGFIISLFCVVSVLFGMLFPFVVVQTIYNNSSIPLSITHSIHFDSLRLMALMSVIMAWISSFFFMHVFLRILAQERRILLLILSVVIGSVLFIEINLLTGQNYFWSFLIGIVYLVSIISFSLFNSLQKFQYATFIYFFVAVVCLALNGMFAIRHFEQQGDLQNQLRFANKFLDERDYFGEYLLHEAADRIASDAFIQNRLASPFLGKEVIRQKVKQVSLSGYFNRYNVDVFLFGPTGEALESGDTTTFSNLINKYDKETFKTEYEGVYSVSMPEGDFSRKYVVPIPIKRNETTSGYVIIELLLKRIIPENVYPELLVDNRFQQGSRPSNLSYAIVADSQIQYSTGDFNYDSFVQNNLGDPNLYTRGVKKEEYLHIAIEDINGRIAIISTPSAPIIFWLADFSFQVILGMVIILLLLLIQGLYNYSKSRSLYLAARIQLILNLAFFLPLIAVSIIALSLTTQSSQEQIRSEFLSKSNRFGNTVAIALQEHGKTPVEFENEFTRLTTLANLDANIFYPSGELMTTSQPLIFENSLLAPYINPIAYKRIQQGDRAFVSTEQVGNLQFYVAYSVIYSPDTGDQTGVLAIPFFQSASSLEQMQITILANILSIFALIFIALIAISFLVTKWLTAPLRIITKTMGRVSLTSSNKPLQWQSDDEIGLMAREYNHMLVKLNDSKLELERNQRERAWREIAQQVAHEIKNPLTPMKLTLQQLERMLLNENQQDNKLSKSVSTLLSQVNSLDDIASSFSSFAKMPEPVMVEVELVSLLNKTVNLHTQEGKILFEPPVKTTFVFADAQLLGRIFSNIIINGLQANRPGAPSEIHVKLEIQSLKCRVSFSDNGRGISPELIDKIFLPHFTTKQSGSGLGLAISKQGIEQMGGKIWFETSSRGTTFIVELPLNR